MKYQLVLYISSMINFMTSGFKSKLRVSRVSSEARLVALATRVATELRTPASPAIPVDHFHIKLDPPRSVCKPPHSGPLPSVQRCECEQRLFRESRRRVLVSAAIMAVLACWDDEDHPGVCGGVGLGCRFPRTGSSLLCFPACVAHTERCMCKVTFWQPALRHNHPQRAWINILDSPPQKACFSHHQPDA